MASFYREVLVFVGVGVEVVALVLFSSFSRLKGSSSGVTIIFAQAWASPTESIPQLFSACMYSDEDIA